MQSSVLRSFEVADSFRTAKQSRRTKSRSAEYRKDLVGGDCGVFESNSLAAVAGYPNISVPAGFVQGLPAGISFWGRAFSEPVLIKIAYAFEQATRHRRGPGFLPTLSLQAAARQ